MGAIKGIVVGAAAGADMGPGMDVILASGTDKDEIEGKEVDVAVGTEMGPAKGAIVGICLSTGPGTSKGSTVCTDIGTNMETDLGAGFANAGRVAAPCDGRKSSVLLPFGTFIPLAGSGFMPLSIAPACVEGGMT